MFLNNLNFAFIILGILLSIALVLLFIVIGLKSSINSLYGKGKEEDSKTLSGDYQDGGRGHKEGIVSSLQEVWNRNEILQSRKGVLYIIAIFVVIYACWQITKGTYLESHITEWLDLLLRWAHIIAGIFWIGTSFYFNFLENSLNRTTHLRKGIAGNLWAIHGGGFYYLEKYKIAPKEIPKELHWFKYEAYFTWITGFALLWIVYYMNANALLIDPNVLDISPAAAIAIGIGTLVISWFVYDLLCKSTLGKKTVLFAIVAFLLATAVAWFLCQVFSSRAAYIHVGAMLGTLMAANVFMVIIPSQKAMVKAAMEGKPVDPALGINAALRSLHNNYMTLPVIFIMISIHFPGTYGHEFNWAILAGLSLASAAIKHYWNLKEKKQRSVWILPAATAAIIAMVIVTAPQSREEKLENAAPVSFSEVREVIIKRCVSCHSASPTDEVWTRAPNNIKFDTPAEIVKMKDRILNRAVITKTMPQANKSGMTQEERDLIEVWIFQGAKVD